MKSNYNSIKFKLYLFKNCIFQKIVLPNRVKIETIFLISPLRKNRFFKKPSCIKNFGMKLTRLCPCKFIQMNTYTNNHHAKNEDVLCNPQNPIKPVGEKTRNIASLRLFRYHQLSCLYSSIGRRYGYII